MKPSFIIHHSSFRLLRALAHELLPILLILYPFLLLLDDLEPGFVRSVVNPHAFLLALFVTGVLAGDASGARVSHQMVVMFAIVGAAIGGIWVAWRIHAGLLGIVVGFLTAIAIIGAVTALRSDGGGGTDIK